MKQIQIALLLCVVALATGCPNYSPKVDFKNPNSLVAKINEHITARRAAYESALAEAPPNTARAKSVRNELIEDAIPYIDGAYVDFITDLQAGRDRSNFVLDLVDLGTSASVGVTKGERPLQIIGVALTAFRGGRKSLDANFYKDTSTPILISKMDGNRAKVRATILEREKNEAADYQLGAAISDLVDYYNAGTLVRAFTQLQQDTAVATQQSEAHLANLKAAGVKGAPTAEQLKASKENAAALRALYKPYKDAKANVQAATAKSTQADQDITDAGAAITNADQKIGEATAQIETATTAVAQATTKAAKTTAEATLTTAQAAKATAEADKVKAEAKKSKAEADKTAAETAKASAITARDQALKNLQGAYDAIAGDSKLSAFLSAIPDGVPDLQPARIAALKLRQQRIKDKKEPETEAEKDTAAEDYATILGELAGIVTAKFTDDPDLNKRLQDILKVNK